MSLNASGVSVSECVSTHKDLFCGYVRVSEFILLGVRVCVFVCVSFFFAWRARRFFCFVFVLFDCLIIAAMYAGSRQDFPFYLRAGFFCAFCLCTFAFCYFAVRHAGRQDFVFHHAHVFVLLACLFIAAAVILHSPIFVQKEHVSA